MDEIAQKDRELLISQSYREFLATELENRKSRNDSYSLRAMARDLEVPASRLSIIINGRTNFTEASLYKVAERMQKPEPIRDFFLNLALWEIHALGNLSDPRYLKAREIRIKYLYTPVDLPHRLVDSWSLSNLALMLLLRLQKEMRSDAALCRRLGVSPEILQKMLDELEEQKLIERTQDGPRNTFRFLELGGNRTEYQIQGLHKKGMKRALWCMENMPFEKRFFYSTFFLMDPAQAAAMSDRIRDAALTIGLDQLPEQAHYEAYAIGTYLVPLTVKEE